MSSLITDAQFGDLSNVQEAMLEILPYIFNIKSRINLDNQRFIRLFIFL